MSKTYDLQLGDRVEVARSCPIDFEGLGPLPGQVGCVVAITPFANGECHAHVWFGPAPTPWVISTRHLKLRGRGQGARVHDRADPFCHPSRSVSKSTLILKQHTSREKSMNTTHPTESSPGTPWTDTQVQGLAAHLNSVALEYRKTLILRMNAPAAGATAGDGTAAAAVEAVVVLGEN